MPMFVKRKTCYLCHDGALEYVRRGVFRCPACGREFTQDVLVLAVARAEDGSCFLFSSEMETKKGVLYSFVRSAVAGLAKDELAHAETGMYIVHMAVTEHGENCEFQGYYHIHHETLYIKKMDVWIEGVC